MLTLVDFEACTATGLELSVEQIPQAAVMHQSSLLRLLTVYTAHGDVIVGGARDRLGRMKQHAALAERMKKGTRAMKEATPMGAILVAMEAVASCELSPEGVGTECASFVKALKVRGHMVVQNLASSTLQACKQLVHDAKNGAVLDSTRSALSTCCQLATRVVSVCGSVFPGASFHSELRVAECMMAWLSKTPALEHLSSNVGAPALATPGDGLLMCLAGFDVLAAVDGLATVGDGFRLLFEQEVRAASCQSRHG